MIPAIFEASKSDCKLAKLLENVQEYAQVYLLAKERQKGCDGLGELNNLKEEFEGAVDEMVTYCKKNGHLPENVTYDIDIIAKQVRN